MTLDLYIGQHKALMEKWKAKHDAEENGFAEDGIVSPEVWFAIPAEEERIMILLKEAYAKDYDVCIFTMYQKFQQTERGTPVHTGSADGSAPPTLYRISARKQLPEFQFSRMKEPVRFRHLSKMKSIPV